MTNNDRRNTNKKNKKIIKRFSKDVSFGDLLFRNLPYVVYQGNKQPVISPESMEIVRAKLNQYAKHPTKFRHFPRITFEGKKVYDITSNRDTNVNNISKKKKVTETNKKDRYNSTLEPKHLLIGHLMFERRKSQEKEADKKRKAQIQKINTLLRVYKTIEELKLFVYPLVEKNVIFFTTLRNKTYLFIPFDVTIDTFKKYKKKNPTSERVNLIQDNVKEIISYPSIHTSTLNNSNVSPKPLDKPNLSREPLGSMKPRVTTRTTHPLIASKKKDKTEITIPEKVKREIQITKRKQSTVASLKKLYNHTCQICQQKQEVDIGCYLTEVHHIQPLGAHHGPDIEGNMIVLCPNDHSLFDRGAITINLKTKKIIHINPDNPIHNKTFILNHPIEEAYVNYHNKHIYLDKTYQ
ncbi:5-methylcytosine-specific restriction enzyme A [Priestia megaterium]|uniref:HNH endonuclease n=1 Tax=Priestia megaterium TaxID=1404 RepID=UPI0039E18928